MYVCVSTGLASREYQWARRRINENPIGHVTVLQINIAACVQLRLYEGSFCSIPSELANNNNRIRSIITARKTGIIRVIVVVKTAELICWENHEMPPQNALLNRENYVEYIHDYSISYTFMR